MNRLIDQLDSIVVAEPDETTVSALIDATRGLQTTAPELIDSLQQAIEPMQTLVEQRTQLEALISGGVNTVGTTNTALYNHTDRLVKITGELTPVVGVFAQMSPNFVPAFVKLNTLSDKFFEHVWMSDRDVGNMRTNVTFTPSSTYTRADCPQYGELKGPSCFTAPLVPTRPELPDVLLPQNYHPPKDLAPPPGTVLGESGNLIAVGPPLINPNPSLADHNPPLPPWMPPAAPVPATSNPALAPTPPPPVPLSPPAPVAPQPWTDPTAPNTRNAGQAPPALPAEAAPASYGGNVGPVGSPQERAQFSLLTGQPATSATQLLLGPLARGTTVSVVQEAG